MNSKSIQETFLCKISLFQWRGRGADITKGVAELEVHSRKNLPATIEESEPKRQRPESTRLPESCADKTARTALQHTVRIRAASRKGLLELAAIGQSATVLDLGKVHVRWLGRRASRGSATFE